MAPKKIAEYDIKRQDDNDGKSNIVDLIEKFDRSMPSPSVILIKVDKGRDEVDGDERSFIIGGYASHGLCVSGGKKQDSGSGDKSCFLFNLTSNLRFNARDGFQSYQYVNPTNTEIKFGSTDLVLKDGFQLVTSHITPPGIAKAGDNDHVN